MRQLASIQKIISLTPIPNADSIELAKVLGWNVVVKKGEFKVGDLVIYCEIDSILPSDNPSFSFLEKNKYRIRTVKMRGQISQGICFPLSILPNGIGVVEGLDVTDILKITKYEPTNIVNSQDAKGNFPSFIPKTDETRVQNLQRQLNNNKDILCYITEKLDGSSITIYRKDNEFGVCSRNIDLKEGNNKFWNTVNQYNTKENLEKWNNINIYSFDLNNIALQGELIGEGIQGNKYNLKGYEIYIFSAFNIKEQKYYDYFDLINICSLLNLNIVPMLIDNHSLTNSIDFYLDLSIGKSKLNDKIEREGIVIRNMDGNTISFKAINNNFLLKYE